MIMIEWRFSRNPTPRFGPCASVSGQFTPYPRHFAPFAQDRARVEIEQFTNPVELRLESIVARRISVPALLFVSERHLTSKHASYLPNYESPLPRLGGGSF